MDERPARAEPLTPAAASAVPPPLPVRTPPAPLGPAAPAPREPIPVGPIPADPFPVAGYAVPANPPRAGLALTAFVALAGAAIAGTFGAVALLMTGTTGRLPLPRHVQVPLLFPFASMWWSTLGQAVGGTMLVFVAQYPAYGLVVGWSAARGRIVTAAGAVLLVHAVAGAACFGFGLY